MRIVILGPSPFSETSCAMAVRVAEVGHVPTGVLTLRTLDRGTLLRKLGQWGLRGVARYARAKLMPRHLDTLPGLSNPYLEPMLKHGDTSFRSLREAAAFYGFPVAVCDDLNAPNSIARVNEWAPDLIIFTGGGILRKSLLEAPRLGVLNVHLGLLPEVRGMSSPEWSLLNRVPVGITIHYMDAGIDTGPILRRYEFPALDRCKLLSDLRHRLVAFGVEKVADVVADLDRGAISATPQSDLDPDNQFFVMHEWLRARASESLAQSRIAAVLRMANE